MTKALLTAMAVDGIAVRAVPFARQLTANCGGVVVEWFLGRLLLVLLLVKEQFTKKKILINLLNNY